MLILSTPFLEFCLSTPVSSSIILFQMFVQAFDTLKIPENRYRESFWNLRYSEKGDLPEHFTRAFSLVIPMSHESEHTKLMTSLITNLLLAVFYLQSLSCEVIDKSQRDLNLSTASIFLCALPGFFQLRFIFQSFHLDLLCTN